MDIEGQMHIAVEVDSHPADVEHIDTYSDRIPHYEAKNYTYIPLPSSMQYYDTEEGWLKEMKEEQLIREDIHLLEVLRRLQRQPFLLIDYIQTDSFLVYDDGNHKQAFQSGMVDMLLDEEAPTFEFTENNTTITKDDLKSLRDKGETYSVHELREEYPDLAENNLSFSYNEQYGIITITGVNKRGMKQMLYKVISELSANLGRKIEDEYPNSENIQKHLRPVSIGRWKKDHLNGLELHISEHMNLIEMMQVIQSSDKEFVKRCGFDSKSDVETLNKINEIRNRVMHANRSLIYDRKEIDEILSVINSAETIISNLD